MSENTSQWDFLTTATVENVTNDQSTLVATLTDRCEYLERQLLWAQQRNEAYESKIERATEVLHREANDRGMCTEFDDIMDEIGFERRTREYEVRIEVSHYLTVTVEASSEDEAIELVENNDPSERVRDDVMYNGFDELNVTLY